MNEIPTKDTKEITLLKRLGYTNPKKLADRSERSTVKITLFEANDGSVFIRMVEKTDTECSEEYDKELIAACHIKKITHPSIVKINKVFDEDPFLIIEMPKYLGDLDQIVKSNLNSNEETCLPTDLIFLVAYQVANALVFLDSKKIIHRDITLANILVEEFDREKGILKIVLADFERMQVGKPELFEGEMDISSGGQNNSPPERYSETYDIWELGAIIYQMITGDFSTKFCKLGSHEVKQKLYGDTSEKCLEENVYLKRLKNSYMVPYLWSCFQNHEKRIPATAIMEEILAQFYFYVSNTKKILTVERKQKPKEFFVMNFFQNLATNEDKFLEILKMESEDMNETESYIKKVFNTMFGNSGVFNVNEAHSNNSLKQYSVYFNKFQGFFMLFIENFEKASEIFDNVLKINYHDFTSFNNKALVKLCLAKKEGKSEKSQQYVRDAKSGLIEAIENDPQYVSAMVNLANIYESEGAVNNAEEYYEKACKHSRIDRQKFNSHLNRAIFKAQQLKFDESYQDMDLLMKYFATSPVIYSTKLLIKWMELTKTNSDQIAQKLKNEILGELVNSDKLNYLKKHIPFQLLKVLYLFKERELSKDSLIPLKELIKETNVEPKILFCSTIVNRFSLQYFESGDVLTIPLFRSEILELIEEIELCISSVSPQISFDDLVQLSRANYSSLSNKIKSM